MWILELKGLRTSIAGTVLQRIKDNNETAVSVLGWSLFNNYSTSAPWILDGR